MTRTGPSVNQAVRARQAVGAGPKAPHRVASLHRVARLHAGLQREDRPLGAFALPLTGGGPRTPGPLSANADWLPSGPVWHRGSARPRQPPRRLAHRRPASARSQSGARPEPTVAGAAHLRPICGLDCLAGRPLFPPERPSIRAPATHTTSSGGSIRWLGVREYHPTTTGPCGAVERLETCKVTTPCRAFLLDDRLRTLAAGRPAAISPGPERNP